MESKGSRKRKRDLDEISISCHPQKIIEIREDPKKRIPNNEGIIIVVVEEEKGREKTRKDVEVERNRDKFESKQFVRE
jgi:hypothetical protein